MLTSDRHIDIQTFVGTLGCTEQIPVRHTVLFAANEIPTSDIVPAEILFATDHPGQRKGDLLPAADFCHDGYVIRLPFVSERRIILFAKLASVHVVDRKPDVHLHHHLSCFILLAGYSQSPVWSTLYHLQKQAHSSSPPALLLRRWPQHSAI